MDHSSTPANTIWYSRVGGCSSANADGSWQYVPFPGRRGRRLHPGKSEDRLGDCHRLGSGRPHHASPGGWPHEGEKQMNIHFNDTRPAIDASKHMGQYWAW
jgi:hypothetical protein